MNLILKGYWSNNPISVDETSALTSIQALEPTTSIAANSEYFVVPANTCLGELVTP